MNCSMRRALVLGFLVLAPGLKVARAQARPNGVFVPPPAPVRPLGIYAVVDVEDTINQQVKANPSITTAELNAYFINFYTDLISNPAVSGLTLQVHWDTLNPNPPTAPDAYFWDYVDDAFSSELAWSRANQDKDQKTIQLIVTPGFQSPSWLLDSLASCDGLFLSPPVTPASNCGTVTFTGFVEGGDSTQLPLPWNTTYTAAWKTFLTALAARYNSNPSFVSIAVAGPTAASAEMLLPNGDDLTQTFGGAAISPNQMWDQLLAFQYPSDPSYQKSDQAFIDAWNDAIDVYGELFNHLTLVVTTGNGLPNLSTSGFTVPSKFAPDCASKATMDCAAETTILSHFIESTVGGTNGKATQTSGMEASRMGGDLGLDGVKFLTGLTDLSVNPQTKILGGAQFNTSFSGFTLQEGCSSTFPPDKSDTPIGCTIPASCTVQSCIPTVCIPTACYAPGVTEAEVTSYKQLKNVPSTDLIPPEQAAYNVLQDFFNKTPAAGSFGGTKGTAPLNYLQIYSADIQYATTNVSNPALVFEGGIPVSVTAQTLLNLASTKLLGISESEP
jgi:hypothetical protein